VRDTNGPAQTEAVGAERVTVTEEERRIEWQAEGASGAAVLEPAGWGTKLTLTAEIAEEVARLEPDIARIGLWARLRGPRPEGLAPPPEPPTPARAEDLEQTLAQLLDDLGSAHRRPFQQG